MKKTVSTILIVGMLSLSLCGCGNMTRDYGTKPMETPSVQDGIVQDRDGVIEDYEGDPANKVMPTAEPTIQPGRP